MFVTPRSPSTATTEILEALRSAGLEPTLVTPTATGASAAESTAAESTAADTILEIDGTALTINLIERAHPNPADLRQLCSLEPTPSLVIADRISLSGRAILRENGWSWLDRRGHLRIWVRGCRIEVDISDSVTGITAPPRSSGNLWTVVGLEIALHALINTDQPASARRVASAIGRSVGTTHELLARFVEAGLIGPTTRKPLMPDLFWETSARWPDDGWVPLPYSLVELAERLDTTELVRVDERAATLGGAKIAAAGDLPARCYVTSNTTLRRLRPLVDKASPTKTFVRLSPINWLPELDGFGVSENHPWRIAHPMLCALRLASDPSRGREIVQAWGIVPGEGPSSANNSAPIAE